MDMKGCIKYMTKPCICSVESYVREQKNISALKTNSGEHRMVIAGPPLASTVPQPYTVSLINYGTLSKSQASFTFPLSPRH